jgi:hypothetical protein
MRQITLGDDLRAKLGDLSGEIALCDATGTVVAYIMLLGHREMLYRLAADLFDDEELARAEREEGGMTTAQVLEHLKSLDAQPAGQGAA